MLVSKNEIHGQEKIQNMGPYTGYFRGKYGEMPCNLHQIRGGRGNKCAKVVQLMNVNRTSYRFGLEKKSP